MAAISSLEKRHNLPPLEEEEDTNEDSLEILPAAGVSGWQTSQQAMEGSLKSVTKDTEGVDVFRLCSFWEAYDRLVVLVERAEMTAAEAHQQMVALRGTFREWMGYGTH